MDPERYAHKQIDEAVAAGQLKPTVGVGRPIKNLRNDPDWWVRAFFEREQLPEKYAEFTSHVEQILHQAIEAPDLDDARATLSTLNDGIERWNDHVEPPFQVVAPSEIWLISQRAKSPGR